MLVGGRSGVATGGVERAAAAHPGVQILPEVRVGLPALAGLWGRGRGRGCAAAVAADCAGDGGA